MRSEAAYVPSGASAATENYRVFAVSASTQQTAPIVGIQPADHLAIFGTAELQSSHERGMADAKAGRFTIFDSVEELLRDLGE